MSLIKIENSFSYLEGFSESSLAKIRECLSYKNSEEEYSLKNLFFKLKMANHHQNFKLAYYLKSQIEETKTRIHVCLLKADLSFPTGLLSRVIETIEETSETLEIEDLRVRPPYKVKYDWYDDTELRYYQKEIIELAKKYERGIIQSCVGSGKTKIYHHLTKYFSVPTLIIVPSSDLKHQIMDSFKDVFGSKDVCEITTAVIKSGKKLKNIRIATIQTLHALKKTNQDYIERALEGVSLLIYDEFHHAASSTSMALLPELSSVYYRFGASGTVTRSDSKELEMWGFLSHIFYQYPATQAIKDGYLTPMHVKIHNVAGKRATNYNTEYSKNYCENKELLLAIKKIFDHDIGSKDQVLILVKQKDKAGKVIHQFLSEIGIENIYISGDSDKNEIKEVLSDFNEKKLKVLIGSSILGEGIDIRSTSHLIMAQGGKSTIAVIQALGRAVRLFPGKKKAYVHDFNFLRTKYLTKHLEVRQALYRTNFDASIETEEE